MIKYYTRACNFIYGSRAKFLLKKRMAFSLCGLKNIAFNHIEIIKRKNNQVKSKVIHIKDIKNLNISEKTKIKKDIKKITSKRKNFLHKVNFS